jgi:RNA polymerase sigma factor (sigma-70 family)
LYDGRALAESDDAPELTSVSSTETTLDLILRVRQGDSAARERLFERSLPPLMRWARGRLPIYARDLADTIDLVQDAAINTLNNLARFHPEHPGALHAYLREAVANRITDHIRRAKRRPVSVMLDENLAEAGRSPLEQAIGQEQIDLYDAALGRLNDLDRAAIVARIELQCSYAEVAEALGKPTANAARVAVVRAIERLIREMDRAR